MRRFEDCFAQIRQYVDKGWHFSVYWHSDEFWSAEFTFFTVHPKDKKNIAFMGQDKFPQDAINKVLDQIENYYKV